MGFVVHGSINDLYLRFQWRLLVLVLFAHCLNRVLSLFEWCKEFERGFYRGEIIRLCLNVEVLPLSFSFFFLVWTREGMVWVLFLFIFVNYIFNYVLKLTKLDNKTTCLEVFSDKKIYLSDICDKDDVNRQQKRWAISILQFCDFFFLCNIALST